MSILLAGDLISVDFSLHNTSDQAVDADSLPTAVLVRKGVDTAVVVTVVNKETGVYNASVTIPTTYIDGDIVQIRMTATISAVVTKSIIYQDFIVRSYPDLTVAIDFITQSLTNAAKDADSLPTGVFVRNAVDDAAVITVVNKETGVYTATGRIPSTYKEGDETQLRITATVDGNTGKQNILLTTLGATPVVTAAETLSYADVIFADDYFNRKLHTQPWDEATTDQQRRALEEGTIRIDRLNFRGIKTVSTQTLEWPRTNTAFAIDAIPEALRVANCEIAIALLDGVDPDLELENLAAVAEGYSSVRSTYSRTTVPEHFSAGIPSHLAWLHLRPLLASVRAVRLRRV